MFCSRLQLRTEDVLGRGSFGVTYRASWHGAVVAVKQLTIEKYTDANNFLRELEVLAHVRHPNVVPFVGVVLQPPSKWWLVFEFMAGDTLATWLHGSKSRPR